MKIGNTILVSFFLVLLLFAIATYLNSTLARRVDENSERFAQSSLVVRNCNRFQRNVLNLVSGLRAYLLTNEAMFIQAYDSAINENDQILSELANQIRDNPPQKKLLSEIKNLNGMLVQEIAEPLVEAKRASGISDSSKLAFQRLNRAAVLKKMEKNVLLEIQRKVTELTNIEYGYRETQRLELDRSIETTRRISFYLTFVSIIGGLCIAFFLAQYMSTRILKMVKMANGIAQGNYEVRTEVKGKNEFSQLGEALNEMAAILSTNISLLQRKNAELNQLAHIVSHDIKAPLRGIDNVVTWIEEDTSFDLPPKMRGYIDIIKRRIVRTENLLQGLLAYSRVGRELHDVEMVDVNQIVDEIKGYLPADQSERLAVQPALPVFRTRRTPLLQVLSNLIVNAFKYHDKPQGYVKVFYSNHPDHYRFFVSDNGPGIDVAYHRKIFEIFQTLQDRDSFESTGVGLAIVKKILDDIHQTIRVESEPGKGATFSFTWPKEIDNEKAN
ncbi:MAG TPA: ATP-binding protein [Cyclobacteriaceae bacterium]|nr:ATP-binding protein [Cyclobacteriaceae bacterium]